MSYSAKHPDAMIDSLVKCVHAGNRADVEKTLGRKLTDEQWREIQAVADGYGRYA